MIRITAEGINYYLENEAAIATYGNSVNTRLALQAAHDAGSWEVYEPPPPGPELIEPDPKGFKVALMVDDLFLLWQEGLPAIAREDMKLAAIADNWPVAQAIYNQLKAAIAPPELGPARWQALADAHGIPLEF